MLKRLNGLLTNKKIYAFAYNYDCCYFYYAVIPTSKFYKWKSSNYILHEEFKYKNLPYKLKLHINLVLVDNALQFGQKNKHERFNILC